MFKIVAYPRISDLLVTPVVTRALPSPQTTLSFGQLEQLARSSYNKGKYSQTVILPHPIIRENFASTLREEGNLTGSAYYFKKALSIQPDHIGANSTKM